MKKIALLTLIFFFNCNKEVTTKDSSLDIEKLQLTNNKYDIYIFTIQSSMSFGSSINGVKIVSHNSIPNFEDDNFIRLDKRPFRVKWNNDKLIIETFNNETVNSKLQTPKIEEFEYQNIKIRKEIYRMFSTSISTEFAFDEFYENGQSLIFKNENDSIIVDKDDSQIHINSRKIEINYFEKSKYFDNNGLSSNGYKLIPNKNFNFKSLLKFQPLIKYDKNR